MAISSDALSAIAAKMRGSSNAAVMSTSTEVSDALETYKEDMKTIEKNGKKDTKKKSNGGAKKTNPKKRGRKEAVKKKTEKGSVVKKPGIKTGSKRKKKAKKENL